MTRRDVGFLALGVLIGILASGFMYHHQTVRIGGSECLYRINRLTGSMENMTMQAACIPGQKYF